MYAITLMLAILGAIFFIFTCWYFLKSIWYAITRTDEVLACVFCFAILAIITALLITPYALCEHKGKTESVVEKYNIYEIDGNYIVYNGKQYNRTNVYIKENDTYKLKPLVDAQFKDIEESEQPYCEIITTTSSWFIFEVKDTECFVYIYNGGLDE